MQTNSLKAILFDMDGLLTNTEPLWDNAISTIVAQFGYEWQEEDHKKALGGPLSRVAKYMWEISGQVHSPDWFLQTLISKMNEAFKGEIPMMPGAMNLLIEVMESELQFGLVTSNTREICQNVLATIPQIQFDTVITFDDVTKPKPDPEGYIKAAKNLGVGAEEVLVFEDSLVGVTAAKNSGARVIAIPTYPGIEESERIKVFQSLTDINLGKIKNIFSSW